MDTQAKDREEKFFSLLQKEFDIYYNYAELEHKTLEELDFTKPELDFFLNQLEQTFDVEICEGDISMNICFADLVEILQGRSRPLVS